MPEPDSTPSLSLAEIRRQQKQAPKKISLPDNFGQIPAGEGEAVPPVSSSAAVGGGVSMQVVLKGILVVTVVIGASVGTILGLEGRFSSPDKIQTVPIAAAPCTPEANSCNERSTCSTDKQELGNSSDPFLCTCLPQFLNDYPDCTDPCSQCHANAGCSHISSQVIKECSCNSGYIGNGTSCEFDFCSAGTHQCHANATCASPHSCTCNPGFSGSGFACEDIDECTMPANNCDSNATCLNTMGSFSCSCNSNFEGDGVNCVANPCLFEQHNCHTNATCVFNTSSLALLPASQEQAQSLLFSCDCNQNFSGNGSFCYFDECKAGSHGCHANATCSSTENGYTCACDSGFVGNGTSCIQGVCYTSASPCHGNATCIQASSFPYNVSCSCESPFVGGGDFCVEDSCLTGFSACDNTTTQCLSPRFNTSDNTISSQSCECIQGFSRLNATHCQDIDECSSGAHNCHDLAICTNTLGSFACACNSSIPFISSVPSSNFVNDTGVLCDVNECLAGSHNCSMHASCNNTVTSYDCQCNAGWQGDGFTCVDVDECSSSSLNNCNAQAACNNTIGSFSCSCSSPYFGDGLNCQLNECLQSSTHNCHANATCTDTSSSFTCACDQHFSGDGVNTCVPDYCSLGLHNCAAGATCTPAPVSASNGTYTCRCRSDFVGDGQTCLKSVWAQAQELTAPSLGSTIQVKQFGSSSAISRPGSMLIAGCPTSKVAHSSQGLAQFYATLGSQWPTGTLVDSQTTGGDEFASSVDISDNGHWVVSSAPLNDAAATDAGAVIVYKRTVSNSTFAFDQFQQITQQNVANVTNSKMGFSTAISGNAEMVASSAIFSSGQGSVFLFSRDNTSLPFNQCPVTAQLSAPRTVNGGLFGYSVAIDRNATTIVCGAAVATANSSTAVQSGAAFVFRRMHQFESFDSGSELLLPSHYVQERILFGFSVAVSSDGSIAVVGAPESSAAGSLSGLVLLYSIPTIGQGSIPAPRVFTPAVSPDRALFGRSVSLNPSGTHLFVGTPGANAGVGSVYVFVKRTNALDWDSQTLLTSPTQSLSQFGWHVSSSENEQGMSVVSIGSPGTHFSDGPVGAGSVFVFQQAFLNE